jgi:hypothetical protein
MMEHLRFLLGSEPHNGLHWPRWPTHILHSKFNNKSGTKSPQPTSSTASAAAADTTNASRKIHDCRWEY